MLAVGSCETDVFVFAGEYAVDEVSEFVEKSLDAVMADISLAVYRSGEVADDRHSRKSSFDAEFVREHREMFVFVFTRIEVKVERSDFFAIRVNIV